MVSRYVAVSPTGIVTTSMMSPLPVAEQLTPAVPEHSTIKFLKLGKVRHELL
jgi:hypothetical protein